jgi:hypothetical protein
VDGEALSYFFHATNAPAARAATIAIHNSQFRRRGGAVSTIVGTTGAGTERCVTSSGLRASFIATAHTLHHAWHGRLVGSNQPRVRGPCLPQSGYSRAGIAFWLSLRHKRGRRRRRLSGRGCSSGVEHNLAKVGVEGSNPFARSKFPQGNKWLRTVFRGRFLLPRPWCESWGSRGEAVESGK